MNSTARRVPRTTGLPGHDIGINVDALEKRHIHSLPPSGHYPFRRHSTNLPTQGENRSLRQKRSSVSSA
jgi:hypothetical protein